MSRIKSKNTLPERKLFSILESSRYKFLKHPKMLGSPDAFLPRQKIVIFVDGEFWHGRNWKKKGKVPPKKYWQPKIERNIARDKHYARKLRRQGYSVLRFWEPEVGKPQKVLNRVKYAVQLRKNR